MPGRLFEEIQYIQLYLINIPNPISNVLKRLFTCDIINQHNALGRGERGKEGGRESGKIEKKREGGREGRRKGGKEREGRRERENERGREEGR